MSYLILGAALRLTLVFLSAFMQSLDLVWWSPPLGFVAVALPFFM